MQYKNILKPEFELGQIIVTDCVCTLMQHDILFRTFVMMSLRRYAQYDWGDTNAEGKIINDKAVETDDQILAVYNYKTNTTIWIITESDRSTTTILFPNEY